MSTLKISKHSDVPTALDLVKEEVDKESRRIFSAGGDALKAGNIKPAKEAIAYAEKLAEFEKKIQKLGDEWKKLEAKIDAAAPEVREIVLPTKTIKTHTGFKQKPGGTKSPKKTFEVVFADGTRIADSKAKVVLAKAIEHIGAAAVSKFGVLVDGEPFVSKNIKNYKRPSSAVPIKGGWYVATHSSTKAKIALLKKIAAKLMRSLSVRMV